MNCCGGGTLSGGGFVGKRKERKLEGEDEAAMEEYEPLDFGFDQNGIKMEGSENTSSMATWWS